MRGHRVARDRFVFSIGIIVLSCFSKTLFFSTSSAGSALSSFVISGAASNTEAIARER